MDIKFTISRSPEHMGYQLSMVVNVLFHDFVSIPVHMRLDDIYDHEIVNMKDLNHWIEFMVPKLHRSYDQFSLRIMRNVNEIDRRKFIEIAIQAFCRYLEKHYFPVRREPIIKKEVPKEPEVPEDVKDALELSELAMDRAKQIREFETEVLQKKNEYYKKHGTLFQKIVAYIK